MSPKQPTSNDKTVGRVKWFNNKSGYGFITILNNNQDIFVHHTSLSVQTNSYKTLYEGEYVEFAISPIENNSYHKEQASSVTGIRGGPLLCETRSTRSRK